MNKKIIVTIEIKNLDEWDNYNDMTKLSKDIKSKLCESLLDYNSVNIECKLSS